MYINDMKYDLSAQSHLLCRVGVADYAAKTCY